ncbi:MAG: CotH kinase family protein [Saprospiraceae bacterium]|nr:CotH kinase family protein [Saprospiraceae bacterium]MBP9209457.1 CotH kinase family protein [Saprospiraceae bacterium]
MKKHFILGPYLILSGLFAQSLPPEMHISDDGRRLVAGTKPVEGFYSLDAIREIRLEFEQADFWNLLTQNYKSKIDIPATLKSEGKSYPNVGVRFKGQTSYQRVTSQKKSFNITMDFEDANQDIEGYETINLNNSYEDNSFIREVLYEHLTRPFCPSLKANYVRLFLQNEDWGLYPCVQALDGDYVKEWFLSNEGTRWRCERTVPPGQGQPGGGFGAGTSTLNYLGADTALYKPHYTLKKTTLDNPWDDLVRAVDALNNLPQDRMENGLDSILDVDRALWFLAKETLFGDDDSYVNKGGMDYYAIFQKDAGRLIPLEYDANSVMKGLTSRWSIFIKENDARYPLCNRLFKVPAMRQRYLAHLRTFFNHALDSSHFVHSINALYTLIDTTVQSDPKKLMTYQAFTDERQVLINWMRERRAFVLAQTEFKQSGVDITSVQHASGGVAWSDPEPLQPVWVSATVPKEANVKSLFLHHSAALDGHFLKTPMFDDGAHQDGEYGDGVYGGEIPGQAANQYVRYYVSCEANNAAGTTTFFPEGAEHDVYFYRVQIEASSAGDIVLNELMAANKTTVFDQDGEYDDWIELYNGSDRSVDVSQWVLTDSRANLDKYRIPDGTIMSPKSYLIVWADEDGKQQGLHANFKLSASGEEILLLDAEQKLVDSVLFGEQQDDIAYARRPNGSGPFVSQNHTFNKNNDPDVTEDAGPRLNVSFYPNPASHWLRLAFADQTTREFEIWDGTGHLLIKGLAKSGDTIALDGLRAGFYIFRTEGSNYKLVISRTD